MPQPYFCHRCQQVFELNDADPIACTRCQGEFVEIWNVPANNVVSPLVAAMNSLAGRFRGPAAAQNQPEQRPNQSENSQGQQQPQQPQAQSSRQIPLRAYPLFMGLEGLPNFRLNFGQSQQAPGSAGSANRPAGAAPPPSGEEQNGATAGRPQTPPARPITMEEFVEELFAAAPTATTDPSTGEIQFSIEFGGFASNDVDQTMNNLLASFVSNEGNRGFNESDIRTYLPMKKVTQAQVDNGAQCTTCFDTFKLDDDVGSLDCNHIFHRPCIEPWLKTKNSCPVCRQKINMRNWKIMHSKRLNEAMLEDLD